MSKAIAKSPLLCVEHIQHIYPAVRSSEPVHALRDLTFEVEEGQFFAIVGKSGCGKSTLLRVIAGLITPTSGRIVLNDTTVVGVPKEVAVVFQDYSNSLMPWLTVEANISLALTPFCLSKSEVSERIATYLDLVGLASAARRYPWQLSGGMQQRVAICRALVRHPRLLLLDEPFGALDAPTRYELEDRLLQLTQRLGITVLMITHDIDEAVYMADCVLVLSSPQERAHNVGQDAYDAPIMIDLSKPRHQLHSRADARFAGYRADVFTKMRLLAAIPLGVEKDPSQ